ncbi:MAG: NCS2 family permease [Elusimicrobiota bacterium]|jgi:AGZA family xanthine/uracil permease-like MFS transporter|nr:NCS2 family permease [Elusimicrobiota bacterium]
MSLFKLKDHKTTVGIEVVAGLTTFFTMAYIIFVNPNVLSTTGMPWEGIFAATLIASALATLLMGLYANVPFALAPGMGLNAFFAFTLCLQMGFTWKQALVIDFISGTLIIIITLTKFRRNIIFAIPDFLKAAIGTGIGLFIAYIGMKNAGFLNFLVGLGNSPNGAGVVPALATFDDVGSLLGLIGLTLTIILMVCRVKGGIFIGIVLTTLIGIPLGIVDVSKIEVFNLGSAAAIKDVAFAAFTHEGFGSIFGNTSRIILTITAILAVFLSATFDAIGTFIGTGRVSGIFDAADTAALENKAGGAKLGSKFEKALLCDGIASSVSGLLGTSTVTTYVESAAGISSGGRTGLTSVVVAGLFLICLPFAGLFGIVPSQATAPALIIVGVLMMKSVLRINWEDLEEAIPAFLTVAVMTFAYSISYGIAAGFIFHCIVKAFRGKLKEVHPILIAVALLFFINFIIVAVD